jgi:hypothetical protein
MERQTAMSQNPSIIYCNVELPKNNKRFFTEVFLSASGYTGDFCQ